MNLENSRENPSLSESQPIAEADLLRIASSTELYVRVQAVVSRLVAGETLVLPVRGNIGDLACFYSFNGAGTTMWEALQKPISFQGICDVIERNYDVNRKKAEEDVAFFLREVCSLGLASVVADSENA